MEDEGIKKGDKREGKRKVVNGEDRRLVAWTRPTKDF